MNIDYTGLALNNYKPTKRADMLAQLEKLAQHVPAEDVEACNVLNSIAAAFAKHTKRPFVASAVSKDDARLVLNYIFNDAEAQQTVATDGRRVHIEAGVAYDEDCFICPKTNKRIESDMNYPKYKHVVPNTASFDTFTTADVPVEFDQFHACFKLPTGDVYFDKRFVLDLGPLDGWGVKVAPVDGHKTPVVFEGPNKKACIMPYRKK